MHPFLTSAEAATYLNIPRKSLYEMVRLHRIPYRRRGGTLIFLKAELDQWMENLPGVRLSDVDNSHGIQIHHSLDISAVGGISQTPEMPLVRRPQPPKIPY